MKCDALSVYTLMIACRRVQHASDGPKVADRPHSITIYSKDDPDQDIGSQSHTVPHPRSSSTIMVYYAITDKTR